MRAAQGTQHILYPIPQSMYVPRPLGFIYSESTNILTARSPHSLPRGTGYSLAWLAEGPWENHPAVGYHAHMWNSTTRPLPQFLWVFNSPPRDSHLLHIIYQQNCHWPFKHPCYLRGQDKKMTCIALGRHLSLMPQAGKRRVCVDV